MIGVAQGMRGKQAGDMPVGLGALPGDGGPVDAIGGRPHASNSASPQLGLAYLMVPNVSRNPVACGRR